MARYELNIRDYYRIVRRHWLVVSVVAFGLGALTWLLSGQPTTYQATARIQYSQATDVSGLILETFYWSGEDNISTQVKLISSQPVAKRVAERLPGYAPGIEDLSLEEAMGDTTYASRIERLTRQIQARQVEYSSLIDITAQAGTPERAKNIASEAANAFRDYSLARLTERSRNAETWIQTRLDSVNRRLDQAQEGLKTLRRQRVGGDDTASETLGSLLARRQRLSDRLSSVREQMRRLRSGPDAVVTQGTMLDIDSGAPYQQTLSDLADLVHQRNQLLLTYTENAEPVGIINQRIALIQRQLVDALSEDEVILQQQLASVRRALAAYPSEEIRLAELDRQIDLNAELRTQLETSLQEVRIRDAEQVEEVRVVNYATSAQAAGGGGQHLKALVGLILGLMLGVVLAFVVETMDTSIGTIEDVEEYLEVPVLSVIPHLGVEKVAAQLVEENPRLRDDPNLEMYARLISQYDPKSPTAEAYRTLRTNLQYAAAGATTEDLSKKNTFVFTSASLQEGKTTTIVNLAITMAQAGSRVLLLGCNMRRPTIYKSFGLERERGMVDILTGRLRWEECVKGVTDMMVGPMNLQDMLSMPGLDNLDIITAGGIPPNPSELLNSPRFTALLEEGGGEYDYVLVDCPPILPVTDAAIVGRVADWAVLVYQVGKVPRNALRRARSHLDNVGAHILGIAMNDVKAEIGGYSPYSQYMTKYYGEETKKGRTLLGRLRGLFGGGEGTETPEKEPKKGEEGEEEGWVDVDYFEQTEGENHLQTLPYSQAEEEGGPEEPTVEGPTSTDRRHIVPPAREEIPESQLEGEGPEGPGPEREPGSLWSDHRSLWLWIAAAVLVLALALILSFTFGLWSDSSGESTRSSAQTAPAVVSPPGTGGPAASSSPLWTVQAASFRERGEAESFAGELSRPPGPEAWVQAVDVPDLGRWYRVYHGRYPGEETARRAARALRRDGRTAQTLVRRLPAPPR
ncbi:MAG: polysaccharide biosynthesis tyrosine autokinase [bacterium]